MKYSLSEVRYEKSATLVEAGPKAPGDEVGSCIQFTRIPLEPLHDMREVRTTLADLLAGKDGLGAEAEDYLYVTLTDEHPSLDAMAKIREAFPNAMSVDYEYTASARLRERSRAAVDPDKMDAVELFEKFYEEQMGGPVDDVQHGIVEKVVRAAQEADAKGEDGRDGEGGPR